jgi:hypothetical protein
VRTVGCEGGGSMARAGGSNAAACGVPSCGISPSPARLSATQEAAALVMECILYPCERAPSTRRVRICCGTCRRIRANGSCIEYRYGARSSHRGPVAIASVDLSVGMTGRDAPNRAPVWRVFGRFAGEPAKRSDRFAAPQKAGRVAVSASKSGRDPSAGSRGRRPRRPSSLPLGDSFSKGKLKNASSSEPDFCNVFEEP